MSNLLLLVSALALATIQSASGIVILKSTDPTLLRRICNKQVCQAAMQSAMESAA
jgi:hypothetical protein